MKPQVMAVWLALVGPLAMANANGDEPRELDNVLTVTADSMAATHHTPSQQWLGEVGPPPPVGYTTMAPLTGLQPEPVPCEDYMRGTGCGWTLEWNCPNQPAGSKGTAGKQESIGYQCCCNQELWRTQNQPINNPTVAPMPPTVLPNGGAGPVHYIHSLVNEHIPRSIMLKWKLMRWFEDRRQCPINKDGSEGFPAWVGWKAVTAAAPAVTTPPKGIAGNRTLFVDGFCPYLSSKSFTCVKENGELKARALDVGGVNRGVTIDLDGIACSLKDISVYRIENQLGVRLDFHDCHEQAPIDGIPNTILHGIPATASMNALLEDEVLAPGDESSQFSEFMLAVCNPDRPQALFLTNNLPKFTRSSYDYGPTKMPLFVVNGTAPTAAPLAPQQPACFSETANMAHVLSKQGCYSDFLFFDLEDLHGNLAKIPAKDIEALAALVTGNQHWRKPVPVPAPVPGAPAPHMISIPRHIKVPVVDNPCAPVTAPPKPGYDPCKPPRPTCASYTCPPPWVPRPNQASFLCLRATGCSIHDKPRCCMLGTTQTTTVFVPEVPGVVVADRVCIAWRNCNCNNFCDCTPSGPPVSVTFTFTPSIPPRPICEDFQWENFWIALIAVFPCVFKVLWIHERCIFRWAMKHSKHVDKPGTCGPHSTLKNGRMASAMDALGTTHAGCTTFTSGTSRSLKTEHHESGYETHWMICADFFLAAIVPVVVVHATYFLWMAHMRFAHNVLGLYNFDQFQALNGIDIMLCPFVFAPLIVALFIMNLMCLIYWFAYIKYTYTEEICESPTVIEVNMSQDGGGAWWRAGGLSPLSWWFPWR